MRVQISSSPTICQVRSLLNRGRLDRQDARFIIILHSLRTEPSSHFHPPGVTFWHSGRSDCGEIQKVSGSPWSTRRNLGFTFRGFGYLLSVQTLTDALDRQPGLTQVVVPDLWQQEAVGALRAGQDVVVQAPTGAGKTLIFELYCRQGRHPGQAIYTVPTRALANDKVAEWRARGWNVGIATGDLAENLEAPVLVATLETQKQRLIRGDGPSLLVVDEYQMLGDAERGLNYELALALAPSGTQLLLLSGSVSNPQDVVQWLQRLGRRATLIRHEVRPVPLEEVLANNLDDYVPSEIRGYWPRLVARVLAEDLGPILIFAPRRQAAETLATELARQLPTPNPLSLTPEQRMLAGDHLVKLLKSRVSYHHSGLSYAARAGVIEPLAKAGQLRVVVATMGLAAGINFSLRSVALAGDSYRREHIEQPLRADEILQMFGRAGRRSIDEIGFALVSANEIRMRDGYPCQLARSGMVDWCTLLGLMSAAAEAGADPFAEAVRVQERLFTTKPIFLGVEESLKHPVTPCRLKTDAERARHVRRRVREMFNSRGEWEPYPKPVPKPLGEIRVPRPGTASCPTPAGPGSGPQPVGEPPALDPLLTIPAALEKFGTGTLCAFEDIHGERVYGRTITVADRLEDGRVRLAKWIRRLTGWSGRQTTLRAWEESIAPILTDRLAAQRTPVVRFTLHPYRIEALLSLAALTSRVPVDRHGVALWKPRDRGVPGADCASCELASRCRQLSNATGTALLWRRLGLVTAAGAPTRRGRVVSFFSQGTGLAIAAGLEDETLPLDELVYELANLDAGFRFCGEESRWAGRLALACQDRYGLQSIAGYLENGLPPKYGAGAEQVVAAVHKNPAAKQAWVNELLGVGDIDRIIIEWRSLLRQIAHAPELDWPRWLALRDLARAILNETESPTIIRLPPLAQHQSRRVDHRLILRHH
jgi:superfamily II DNA/RNA helicase